MYVKVIINCDNAAFEDENCEPEVGRILFELGKACMYSRYGIEPGGVVRVPLRDVNGNTVGYMESREKEE